MKKKRKFIYIIITIIVIILLSVLYYFFYPKFVGMQADGGTKVYEAKLYTLVHWGEMNPVWTMEDGTKLYGKGRQGWKIYWYPNQDAWLEEKNPDYFPMGQYNEWLESKKENKHQ